MLINWPFSKRYHIHCPDGTIKTVYKNVDNAFPLFIPGWKGDIGADIKGLEQASANVRATYEGKIQGLLFSLDDRNQSLMMTFRGIYMVYTSDPCSGSGFFERQVAKLLEEQHRLFVLRTEIQALIELAKNHPERGDLILSLFHSVVERLGGKSISEAAALEIAESRAIAKEWIEREER